MAENQNETVIELATDGRIEKADVETAMRQLDTALERGDTVHVFAEVRNFKGMSSEAWRSDLGNAFRYLTRLRQFGRIAIVSDQACIRNAARIENALLPYVRYQSYTHDRREHALAWVRGDVDCAHPESLRVLENGDSDIFTFEIDGRITSADARNLAERLSAAFSSGGGRRLLGIVRHYDGFEPSLLVDTRLLELKIGLLRHIERYALVGGPDWISRLTNLFDPLLKMEARHFAASDEEAARAWLRRHGG